ncbi:MAG TPA: hypothetical protein VHH88_09970, partial [Verrucomicrobiae bacterium]|nr:hypothetical protein [Verrucomicrobiae bacterium]
MKPLKLFCVALAAALLCLAPRLSLADWLVPDCLETNLQRAVLFGGHITYTQDCSITLTSTLQVDTQAPLILDAAGHNVTISGNNSVALFSVGGTANLTLIGITLTGGKGD